MPLLRSKNVFYVGFCSWLSIVPLSRKNLITREFQFCSNSFFFPFNKTNSELYGYVLKGIFRQQVFWNSKFTECWIYPKSNLRSVFFPGLLLICCSWVPVLGISWAWIWTGKKQLIYNSSFFHSILLVCCSAGKMFKTSRAIFGGFTAPKLPHGSCLWSSLVAGRNKDCFGVDGEATKGGREVPFLVLCTWRCCWEGAFLGLLSLGQTAKQNVASCSERSEGLSSIFFRPGLLARCHLLSSVAGGHAGRHGLGALGRCLEIAGFLSCWISS